MCLCPRNSRFLESRLSSWLTVGPSRWHYPPSLMCGQLAPLIGVSDFAILKCRDFMSTKSLICRSPTFFGSLTCILNGWMVQVKPQTSPNANPKALICVSPDGSNADESLMVATCPNQMDGSDCIEVFTMDFPNPLLIELPICRLSSDLCHVSHPDGRSRSDLAVRDL